MTDPIRELANENMTLEQARQVREWRCSHGATWRSVAAKAAEVFGDWVASGHQLFGQAICERAAEMLDEDPYKEPWN